MDKPHNQVKPRYSLTNYQKFLLLSLNARESVISGDSRYRSGCLNELALNFMQKLPLAEFVEASLFMQEISELSLPELIARRALVLVRHGV